ncbi:hypothetical protein Dsin_008674 [Dipteronia sinensis]|uniref:hAT-like transposase RNase-H fold domain-containing protein n=1 Tax=Dipteronia sinensis TaxID=43782 RepID=A0AAE0EB58_9ROSI|nr:hypothetical protein Dsin_008674 [Dipteronia sinensis]
MSRNTLKSEVIKLYEVEKSRTMMMLDENTSRIALTTDMWTSNQQKGYVVVTAHFIDSTWKLRSRFLRLSLKSWLDSDVEVIRLMATNMTPKFEKYWDKIHGVIAVAVVLDPRYKMDLIDYFFPRMYGIDYELKTQRIFELCNDLVSEYQAKEKGGVGEGIGEYGVGSSFTFSSSSSFMWDVKGFESYKRKHGRQRELTFELETYLDRLHPHTVEALMCTKNWIWAQRRGLVPEDEILRGEVMDEDDE